jgi:small subunit ribosomal protein S5
MRNTGRREKVTRPKSDMIEKVIQIDRVSRTVKGGRRIRFRALVVIGDGKGKVGIGVGKAGDVSLAISKANAKARRKMCAVTIINETIPYEVTHVSGSARIHLKPAPKGTSVIAGGTVRAIIEAVGIRNIVAKSLGSANKHNIAQATLGALQSLNKLHTLYSLKETVKEDKKKDVKQTAKNS